MVNFLRHFFSYVPAEPPAEVPETEPSDPNLGRTLSDAYQSARRNLAAVCGLCVAWATAQFSLADTRVEVAGLHVDLKSASVPLLLAVFLFYFTLRWTFEFAVMPRHVRRWRLAQLDFRAVSVVGRLSILLLAAGAVDRSSRSVATVAALLVGLAVSVVLLTIGFMLVTMPVRMWARSRANRISAANAALEAFVWAGVFAVSFTVFGVIATAIVSYRYEPWRRFFWRGSPDPIALAFFVLAAAAVFLSHWLLRPLFNVLFSKRPSYRTERMEDGGLKIKFIEKDEEPLL